MCHYIKGTLTKGADAASVARLAAHYERQWESIDASPVLELLQSGETYYWTTVGHCDCGTMLGRKARDTGVDHSPKIRHLERKGWSKTKIERWIADKNSGQEKSINQQELKAWFDFISQAVSTGTTGDIGLLLH